MNTEQSKTTVELHLKRYYPIGNKTLILFFSFLLLPETLIIAFLYSSSSTLIISTMMTFYLSLVVPYIHYYYKYDRIILNETGIACSYSMPIYLKKLLRYILPKEWSFTWREIDKIVLQPAITGSALPQYTVLILQKKKEIKKIMPMHWINAESNSMKLPKMVKTFQIRQFKPSELREILFSYPMLAYMKEHAIPLNEDNKLLKENTQLLMIRYIVFGFILVMGVASLIYSFSNSDLRSWKKAQESTESSLPISLPAGYAFPQVSFREWQDDHQDNSILSLSFDPTGRMLAIGGRDGMIKLREVKTGNILHTLTTSRYNTQALAFHPSGHFFASGGNDNTIEFWDANTGKRLRTLRTETTARIGYSGIYSLAFSPDGKKLASGNWDNSVTLWNTNTDTPLHIMYGRKKRLWGLLGTEAGTGHENSVNSVAFSPDGKILASAGFDGVIKLWDSATGTLLNTLQSHRGWVTSVTFNHDGRLLISAGDDSVIRIWELATYQVLRTLQGHYNSISQISVSPDGLILASSSHDSTINIWELASGKRLKTLKGHEKYVNSVAFSSLGILASTGMDRTVRLWH